MGRTAWIVIAGLIVSAPTTAPAQFVTSLGGDAPRICPDRPARPDWIEDIAPREAHRANLVRHMYRAQSMRAVVESEDCSCETRFPSWDEANEYYDEHYAGLKDRWEILEATSTYRRTANEYRMLAMPICQEQGNW